MVNYFKSEKKVAAPKALEVKCSSLDILGRGVCKKEGKIYFVDNLMPGEKARIVPVQTKDGENEKTNSAKVCKFIETSADRQEPSCPLQDQCGGCPLAYLPKEMSFDAKIEGVSKLLSRSILQGKRLALSSKVSAAKGSSRLGRNSTIKQALAKKQAADKNARREEEIRTLCAEAVAAVAEPAFKVSFDDKGYRRACRLAIRGDHGRLSLGFRAAGSQDLIKVSACEVLTDRLNALLPDLQNVINKLSGRKSLGHLELLDTDGAVGVLLRITAALCHSDVELLRTFGIEKGIVISLLESYKQIDDSEAMREKVLNPETADLYVMSGDCRILCSPSSFVQVNSKMNKAMIEKVLAEVAPHEDMKVLDLFSGLGNFSMPIAKAGCTVAGVDIVSDMVRRANANAALNGIGEDKARFFVADLEEPFESQLWAKEQYDVVVMDPGRTGARRAVTYMNQLRPKKIVMISCNPLAAARDSAQLLSYGYNLQSWGAFDMFPRTSHLEIMLTFTVNEKA